MTNNFAFWDTSAIVPLCCRQNTTQPLRQLRRRYEAVVSCFTEVEAISALNRLRREDVLTAQNYEFAGRRLQAQREAWREIEFSDKLCELAKDAIETHGLRALDGLQFASALIWCQGKPQRRIFVCADVRLRQAAQAVKFTVVPDLI